MSKTTMSEASNAEIKISKTIMFETIKKKVKMSETSKAKTTMSETKSPSKATLICRVKAFKPRKMLMEF